MKKKIFVSALIFMTAVYAFSQNFDAESYAKEYDEKEANKVVETEKIEFGYKVHVGSNPWVCSDGSKKGIVIDDYVNVRNAPGMNGKKIGQVGRGFPLKIYSFSGSGKMVNGLYDYWAKISSEQEVYINAYYITTLPFSFILDDDDWQFARCLCVDRVGKSSYFAVDDRSKLYDLITCDNARLNFFINDLLEKAENREPNINVQMTSDVGFLDEIDDPYIPHIAFVTVKSPSVKLAYDISIGSNIKDIKKAFGKEVYFDENKNFYQYEGGSVINEIVSKVYLFFHVDENNNLRELFVAQYCLDE